MNALYPQQEFESDVAAIKGFAELLIGGYQNPLGVRGTVKLRVPERPEHSFVARLDAQLHIDWTDLDRATDTTVTVPIATLKRLFREFEVIDFRDPAIIGTMEFSGNLDLANHLAKCCLRPSTFTVDWFRAVGALHRAKGYRDLTEVPYLHRPTQRQILELIAESCPAVITGLEPSPPCKDWTLDRLAQHYSDAVVRVRSATQSQTMRDFVRELKDFMANPYDEMVEGFVKPYTEGAQLPQQMWDDFGPLFFDREDFIPPQLWLGAVPTHVPTSSLHRDPRCGFLLQVIGRKRLDLYSADQEDLLYPYKAYNNYQPCWYRPQAPDPEVFPKAQQAKCLSVTLNPGEMIVQPAGWFHQVHALDSPNMSVSYFWRY
ncbi:cupin-like domain-containing protein [Tropicibacter naphthalenivorans]|uniref:JmjC domain-containing protein n=1 Tax=Tropicibacter naphthalenivorans TaxID=441103 RepID=A0A0P1GEJ5_9RHOB|nr:cupin-like domain-containing protein [Tropicibacter naphthalenivorans]CUH80086.1 hypothetical protein TRN7648_02806 [Tropicibacter naphthalenivorans]SMC84528.1 Cupin-like domain-containing protein [Tropicibacter naphthalenivorans]